MVTGSALDHDRSVRSGHIWQYLKLIDERLLGAKWKGTQYCFRTHKLDNLARRHSGQVVGATFRSSAKPQQYPLFPPLIGSNLVELTGWDLLCRMLRSGEWFVNMSPSIIPNRDQLKEILWTRRPSKIVNEINVYTSSVDRMWAMTFLRQREACSRRCAKEKCGHEECWGLQGRNAGGMQRSGAECATGGRGIRDGLPWSSKHGRARRAHRAASGQAVRNGGGGAGKRKQGVYGRRSIESPASKEGAKAKGWAESQGRNEIWVGKCKRLRQADRIEGHTNNERGRGVTIKL
ncbi:hypothetical protein K438DRAFT_1749914 [Mycena galopus ATCC 62051]|nr:hypothetical protein K438DRAFT_1749914 [Mycena galopus ATCC 62051]